MYEHLSEKLEKDYSITLREREFVEEYEALLQTMTVIINIYNLIFGFTFNVFLALMINEMQMKRLKLSLIHISA